GFTVGCSSLSVITLFTSFTNTGPPVTFSIINSMASVIFTSSPFLSTALSTPGPYTIRASYNNGNGCWFGTFFSIDADTLRPHLDSVSVTPKFLSCTNSQVVLGAWNAGAGQPLNIVYANYTVAPSNTLLLTYTFTLTGSNLCKMTFGVPIYQNIFPPK